MENKDLIVGAIVCVLTIGLSYCLYLLLQYLKWNVFVDIKVQGAYEYTLRKGQLYAYYEGQYHCIAEDITDFSDLPRAEQVDLIRSIGDFETEEKHDL